VTDTIIFGSVSDNFKATYMSRPKVKFMEVLPITPNELSYKFYQILKNNQLKKNIIQFMVALNFG
jgi:hypothetical protein